MAATDPRTPTRRRVRSADGTGLAVREHGDPARPTVLLVHGYPDTSALWEQVVALLEDDLHVVAYDVRGAGESDRPAGLGPYALRHLAEDVRAVADAVSPDRPVHLVGHDWGALQGWEAAARPGVRERLASFTAIAGPSLDLVGQRPRPGRRPSPAQTLKQAAKSWYIAAFHVPFLAPVAWRLWVGDHWRQVFARTEGQRPPAGHPAPTVTQDGIDGIRLYRRNVLERFLRPRYDRVEVPLVQVGITLQDVALSPHLYADLPGRMPELWVRRADSTHWLPLLHPELAASWIRQAVAATEDGAAPPADAEVHREDAGDR